MILYELGFQVHTLYHYVTTISSCESKMSAAHFSGHSGGVLLKPFQIVNLSHYLQIFNIQQMFWVENVRKKFRPTFWVLIQILGQQFWGPMIFVTQILGGIHTLGTTILGVQKLWGFNILLKQQYQGVKKCFWTKYCWV